MKMKRKPWSKGIAFLLILAICFGMSILQLPAIEAQAESTPDGLKYEVDKNQTVTITDYRGSATELQIPAEIDGCPVTRIGYDAFYDCNSLTSIKIPDSVTSIGAYAFGTCSSLTSIEIPGSVTSIESAAFSNCRSLTKIDVDSKNKKYVSDAGVLFDKELTILMACPGGKEGTYSIPDSVTHIVEHAFHGCSSLTSIEIPAGVTSIEYGTFAHCSSLTNIEIPDSVTSIGRYVFAFCSSLTNIEIPDSVTSIGNLAFYWCSSLTSIEIPDSVTSIEDTTFSDCSSLTSIEIPAGVTSIGKYAFSGCSSLTSIEIPDSVTSIGDEAFSGCSSLTNIEIPDSVTSIGYVAFSGCNSLTSIQIPDSVTSINRDTFSDCSSLTSIEIPDSVTYIGSSAFQGCSSLTSIEIPNSVTNIEEDAFSNCSSLTSIKIPNSVTDIGAYAFSNCSSLTSVKIPNSVTNIGFNAFGDTAVDHVVFSGSQDAWNKLSENWSYYDILRSATVHYDTEENVFTPETPVWPDCINNGYTTYKCSLCKKEYRSDFVPPTGHSFQDDICSKCGRSREDCIESAHPYGNNTDETYTIYRPGASEIRITFSSASKLFEGDRIIIYGKENYEIGSYYGNDLASKQIQVPGDTVKIKLVTDETGSAYGFALSDIEVITTDPTEPTPPDAFEVSVTSDQTASIDSYTGTETDIVIPEEINGHKTTSISDGAFKDSPVTSIVLPESVTKIGAGAFAGSSLKRITITANEIEIAEDAFNGCDNVIICCYSASKAYAFAQAHGIAVELLDAKPAVTYGDLDGSGNVDANDALLILKIAAKLQTPTEEQNIAGDVDKSGSVDANDALDVLKKAAKLIDIFPVEAN